MINVNKKDLRALNAKLRQIKVGSEKDAEKALNWFLLSAKNDIKRDAPVDTGNLRKSIKGQKLGKLSGVVESIALGEDNFDYAPVQEYGSVFRSPKPYFYPNIRRNFKRAMVMLRQLNRKTVRK